MFISRRNIDYISTHLQRDTAPFVGSVLTDSYNHVGCLPIHPHIQAHETTQHVSHSSSHDDGIRRDLSSILWEIDKKLWGRRILDHLHRRLRGGLTTGKFPTNEQMIETVRYERDIHAKPSIATRNHRDRLPSTNDGKR